jgi:hypothetical protein
VARQELFIRGVARHKRSAFDPDQEAGNLWSASIPASVDDLCAPGFESVLRGKVTAVEVLDADSGTTGRARVWHAECDPAVGTFVMVLEDLAASGCRFPADDGNRRCRVVTDG